MAQQRSASADNGAATITFAGVQGLAHSLETIIYSYNGVPSAGNLKVESPAGTILLDVDIVDSGPGQLSFEKNLSGPAGEAMIVTLAAGGVGVIGKLNAITF